MSFIKDIPDYKSYEDDEYSYVQIPSSLNGAVCGLINFATKEDNNGLTATCHELAGLIPCEPTTNWGRDYLLRDLSQLINRLANSKNKFPVYMDFLMWVGETFNLIDELNNTINDCGLGYVIVSGPWYGYNWGLRKDHEPSSKPLKAAQATIKDVCAQASEHLRQAVMHLENAKDSRARKDALRDSLSAMEAFVKELGGADKIDDAIKNLQYQKIYGEILVVRDGLGIWNRVHELYPDVRHGNPKSSDLTEAEARYWIDRTVTYVTYLERRRREFDK